MTYRDTPLGVYKKYLLPTEIQEKIQNALLKLGTSLSEHKRLAQAILHLSDHYQQNLQQTPWTQKEALIAGIVYYYPLNYIRNLKVFDEIRKVGFPMDSDHFLDFGSGLGPSSRAAKDSGFETKSTHYVIERSPQALEWQNYFTDTKARTDWQSAMAPKTCAIFSYSLNELSSPPPWFFQLQDIIILEPSTQQKSRELIKLRSRLVDAGYSIWAPCTHHQACPLLTHSEKDWCHDRVHWDMPEWFKKIEDHLPIKNRTLTFSYLLASRTSCPRKPHRGRVIGDELKEKGKTRWLYCQDDERLFLAWMTKQGVAPEIHRGETLLMETFEKKSNEIRFTEFQREPIA